MAKNYPQLQTLFTVQDLGGWDAIQKKFFANGATFDAHSWHGATEAMILHIQRSGELMEILHCRQAESSLLRLFAWLAKRFGQEVEQGQLIDLRLTHQEIADLIGLTRVTVTRLLNDLKKQGIIQRVQRQFILVHDQLPFWHYEI